MHRSTMYQVTVADGAIICRAVVEERLEALTSLDQS
jgi:hypothetical protein